MKGKENSKHVPLDPEDQKKKLARRLKELRIKKGYANLEKFANDHGFTGGQYGRYERGMELTFTTLVRLANAFEMTLDEVFKEGFD